MEVGDLLQVGESPAQLLEGLTGQLWNHPALGEGWTVRDVAAHLTLQQPGPGAVLPALLRHPGGLERTTRENARDRAGRPTDRLIAQIRAMVGSRSTTWA